jgi:hypothetical protein
MMTTTYDPMSFLDIYYLIDAHGRIAYADSNPDSTMSALLNQVKRVAS